MQLKRVFRVVIRLELLQSPSEPCENDGMASIIGIGGLDDAKVRLERCRRSKILVELDLNRQLGHTDRGAEPIDQLQHGAHRRSHREAAMRRLLSEQLEAQLRVRQRQRRAGSVEVAESMGHGESSRQFDTDHLVRWTCISLDAKLKVAAAITCYWDSSILNSNDAPVIINRVMVAQHLGLHKQLIVDFLVEKRGFNVQNHCIFLGEC